MNSYSRRQWLLQTGAALAAASMAHCVTAQRIPAIDLLQLHARRSDEGLMLSYQVQFDLPQEVEDALMKGIAIVFVARAEVFTERWYWTDKSHSQIERRWRLAYHPLSRHWRVSFDGLSQQYGSVREALAVIQRNRRWKLLDTPLDGPLDYLEFSFEIDHNELPRPLQIGLSDQSNWHLHVARRVPISPR